MSEIKGPAVPTSGSALSEIGALLKFILANSSLKVVADTLGGLPWVAADYKMHKPVSAPLTDPDVIAQGSHFMLHAALVMGWAYHASTKTSPVASETWKWMKSTAAAMNMPAETNMDILTSLSGVTAEEVLDTCWESPGVMMPGHYCVLDRRSMSIVIAIRGTLSLADTLTDLTATVAPFVNGYGHKGMVEAAKLLDAKFRPMLRRLLQEKPEFKRVVVTGHSLGAGTASLLSILLHDEFPVTCYAYGCPPVVSAQLAADASAYIHSFVFRYDVICRLSIMSLYRLTAKCRERGQRERERAVREAKRGVSDMVGDVKRAVLNVWPFGKKASAQPTPPPTADLLGDDVSTISTASATSGEYAPSPQVQALVLENIKFLTDEVRAAEDDTDALGTEEEDIRNDAVALAELAAVDDRAAEAIRARAMQPLYVPGRVYQLFTLHDLSIPVPPPPKEQQYAKQHEGQYQRPLLFGAYPVARQSLKQIALAASFFSDHMPHRYQEALENLKLHHVPASHALCPTTAAEVVAMDLLSGELAATTLTAATVAAVPTAGSVPPPLPPRPAAVTAAATSVGTSQDLIDFRTPTSACAQPGSSSAAATATQGTTAATYVSVEPQPPADDLIQL